MKGEHFSNFENLLIETTHAAQSYHFPYLSLSSISLMNAYEATLIDFMLNFSGKVEEHPEHA